MSGPPWTWHRPSASPWSPRWILSSIWTDHLWKGQKISRGLFSLHIQLLNVDLTQEKLTKADYVIPKIIHCLLPIFIQLRETFQATLFLHVRSFYIHTSNAAILGRVFPACSWAQSGWSQPLSICFGGKGRSGCRCYSEKGAILVLWQTSFQLFFQP